MAFKSVAIVLHDSLERRGLLDDQALIVTDGRFHLVYTKTNVKADQARPIGGAEDLADIFPRDLQTQNAL